MIELRDDGLIADHDGRAGSCSAASTAGPSGEGSTRDAGTRRQSDRAVPVANASRACRPRNRYRSGLLLATVPDPDAYFLDRQKRHADRAGLNVAVTDRFTSITTEQVCSTAIAAPAGEGRTDTGCGSQDDGAARCKAGAAGSGTGYPAGIAGDGADRRPADCHRKRHRRRRSCRRKGRRYGLIPDHDNDACTAATASCTAPGKSGTARRRCFEHDRAAGGELETSKPLRTRFR